MIIIRDSEESYENAIKSIQSALCKSKFPIPTNVNTVIKGIYNNITGNVNMNVAFTLFPSLSDDKRNGTLEDLYIENLKENNVEQLINDIDSFLYTLKSKGRKFTWYHKTKLHTYFSVTNDFVSCKIGQATKYGAFNFECDEMNSLKLLLEKIII